MIDQIISHLRSLVPPSSNGDKRLRAWRINVCLSLFVIGTVLAFHIAASKGALAYMGIPAVSRADELQQVNQTVRAILKAIYLPQIRAKIRQRCDTPYPQDREKLNREIDYLLAEYKRGNGTEFLTPGCDEV